MVKLDKKLGLKNTKAREAILNILNDSDIPLSAEMIFNLLDNSKIEYSTVYRTLNTFEQHKIVKKEINADKIHVYSLNEKEDCHYLVCVKCHKRVKLDFCPYHNVTRKIEKETGFEIFDQNTDIYGLCSDCKD